jgi:hypothetical protein
MLRPIFFILPGSTIVLPPIFFSFSDNASMLQPTFFILPGSTNVLPPRFFFFSDSASMLQPTFFILPGSTNVLQPIFFFFSVSAICFSRYFSYYRAVLLCFNRYFSYLRAVPKCFHLFVSFAWRRNTATNSACLKHRTHNFKESSEGNGIQVAVICQIKTPNFYFLNFSFLLPQNPLNNTIQNI